MPYFYNNDVNILFVHIPKTGGTSLEKYFSTKFNTELNKESLYTIQPKDFFNGISYQHQLFKTIKMNKSLFRIDYENLQVITIVRNPYFRIISDLFFKNLIKESFSKDDVHKAIENYFSDINNVKHDNHRIPQYLFLTDDNNNLIKNISIFKTETLNKDMIELGFTDFNSYEHVTNIRNKNYYSYLNMNSINLINEYYEKDFTYFNYDKILNTTDLNYKTFIEEVVLTNKHVNMYFTNYLNSIQECKKVKNITECHENDENNENDKLMSQYKNINKVFNIYYKDYKEKIIKTFDKFNK